MIKVRTPENKEAARIPSGQSESTRQRIEVGPTAIFTKDPKNA
jgi:hypothetical protein